MVTYNDKDHFVLIDNIPLFYHSSHLRNFFSSWIESGDFSCFHYRHRPSKHKPLSTTCRVSVAVADSQPTAAAPPCCCCIATVKSRAVLECVRRYNGKHWQDSAGNSIGSLCSLSQKSFNPGSASDTEQNQKPYDTDGSGPVRKTPLDWNLLSLSEVLRLPEMNPPKMMPQGNVGTSTAHFQSLINNCEMPALLIKKLGLAFPVTKQHAKYSRVQFDYDMTADSNLTQKLEIDEGDDVATLSRAGTTVDAEESFNEKQARLTKEGSRMDLKIEEKLIEQEQRFQRQADADLDNDTCEEWERHEAMVDDPSDVERNAERLYEEDAEVVWDKGGPGLVWYTDANYWDKKEGDFDERTADDWDVDMSEYFEKGSGDKDARDLIDKRHTDRRWAGVPREYDKPRGPPKKRQKLHKSKEHPSLSSTANDKDFARRLMETQGWTEGEGLGSSVKGIAEALENDGQNPRCKAGLGYHGEKLVNKYAPPKSKRPGTASSSSSSTGVHLISTVYDDHEQTDPPEELLRRNEPYNLKYRGTLTEGVRFHRSADVLAGDNRR